MGTYDPSSVVGRAARAGADVAAASFRGSLEVETKSNPADFVTDVDREAQRAILAVLREADPGGVVVAEEDDPDVEVAGSTDASSTDSGVATAAVPTEGTAWIVDPIDGTRNYVAGTRLWATSVAAVVDGETTAAATLMPAYGDEYVLGDDGPTRNGEPIAPSEFDEPATFSVAPLGWWPRDERGEFARLCGVLGERFGDVRRYGCAQAALAMVAAGELEAVVATRRIQPWDAVAGVAMVERAGGRVTDVVGNDWHPGARGLVASAGPAHDALVAAARHASS